MTPYEENETSLHDIINDTGFGVIGLPGRDELPVPMIEYCMSALPFFGLKTEPAGAVEEVVRIGAMSTYFALDVINPYAFFMGMSDVNYSDHWQNYSFDIYDDLAQTSFEADPDKLETFVAAPQGQAEQFYQEQLRQGGLWFDKFKNGDIPLSSSDTLLDLLDFVGEDIRMCLEGAACETPLESLREDQLRFDQFIQLTGGQEWLVNLYFDVAAWASALWFLGPEGRAWRNTHHEIFAMVAEDGFAAMYEGMFVQARHLRMNERPARSCVVCGLTAWCVDLVQIEGTTRYMCERHINGPIPLFEQATCGTKICRAVTCPHHPEYGNENALNNQLRRSGQLTSRAHSQNAIEGMTGKNLLEK